MPKVPLTARERAAVISVTGELEHLDDEEKRRVLMHVAEQQRISLEPDADFSVGQ